MAHVNNPYADGPPDYFQLARDVPRFAPFLRPTPHGLSTIDYKNEDAALSSALLERDFGLRIELPRDRLCPMIPVEYAAFILELVHLIPHRSPHVRGLDIGTGASAIYALLVVKMQPDAFVYASEVDKDSQYYAKRNVDANDLAAQVRIVCSSLNEHPLFPEETWADIELDFTMCNPPFYESRSEIEALAAGKNQQPRAVCTGASNELITEGGEVKFVGRMIEESTQIGNRIRNESIPNFALLSFRKLDCQITNYIVHALSSGQTTRHILVWSFSVWRLPQAHAHITPFTAKLSPRSNVATYRPPSTMDAPTLQHLVITILGALDDVTTKHFASGVVQMTAVRNSWSRAARRKAQNPSHIDIVGQDLASIGDKHIEAAFRIQQDNGAGAGCLLQGEWMRGSEEVRADWLKLWAHVTRKISDHKP
ncbi:BQ2448_7119 [Microbotryum intermedium]|uniref:BQ2448_7119 protein n=1 Tax=Microbotryum intermedium TaxID=269621 RepID=A0A238FMT1_9BASI|nr:BQ2448_7119 [Microbotryum intermedium]